jgi:hypothetical protein
VLVVEETGFLKKGRMSAGVARVYAETAGRAENGADGTAVIVTFAISAPGSRRTFPARPGGGPASAAPPSELGLSALHRQLRAALVITLKRSRPRRRHPARRRLQPGRGRQVAQRAGCPARQLPA